MTPTPPPSKTAKVALAACSALLLLSLLPTANADLVGIPPITIIGSPPDVGPIPDPVTIIGTPPQAFTCGVFLGQWGVGAGVTYRGVTESVCGTPGPNGGDCLEATTVSAGTLLAQDLACYDTDSAGRPCVSVYAVVPVWFTQRNCVGNYPEGYCAESEFDSTYAQNLACQTSDETGNSLCGADTVRSTVGVDMTDRACLLSNHPGDGLCATNRLTSTTPLWLAHEQRVCLQGDDGQGHTCVGVFSYAYGSPTDRDTVCGFNYGSDGTCASNRATGTVGDEEVRACQVYDYTWDGDAQPCAQAVRYSYGWEYNRERACYRPGTEQGECADVGPAPPPANPDAWACALADAATGCLTLTGGVLGIPVAPGPLCGGTATGGDDDGDQVPDTAELLLCGSAAEVLLFDQPGVPGHCNAIGDYQPEDTQPVFDQVDAAVGTAEQAAADAQQAAAAAEAQALALAGDAYNQAMALYGQAMGIAGQAAADALAAAGGARDMVDLDHDGIPDAAEPTLCLVEFQTLPQDGSCFDAGRQDYTPIWGPLPA